MKIQVLGSGCKKCKELYERTQKAVQSMDTKISVEYITDVQKIVEMGVMSSPVLAIDGKPIIVGILPETEKIKQVISDYLSSGKTSKDTKKCSGCSCGGKC